jgi:hypothetical protein
MMGDGCNHSAVTSFLESLLTIMLSEAKSSSVAVSNGLRLKLAPAEMNNELIQHHSHYCG